MRCNVRAGVPDPPGRQNSLKCDDECSRLERNRKLAVALNIADDHIDDHIPYSTTTLKMYVDNVAWCHEQEEILRIFAADEDEKRYRFRPMRNRQRAFIHSLAEDFGFDGESVDPEPHRHIVLFKTPKFVAAPMKTLAQAARIKRAQLSVATPVARPSTPESRANEVKLPEYNGLLLKKPRFALTEDELRPIIRSVAPTNDFDIVFLSSIDGIALLPRNEWNGQEQTQTLLETLQPIISAAVSREGLASSAILCEYDVTSTHAEPRVLHEAGQTTTSSTAAGGWSQVAAKRSAAMAAPTIAPVGQRSSFTVLGSKLAEAKKKKEEEKAMEKRRKELLKQEVVEDWSAEVDREEEEKARSGQTSPQLPEVAADGI
ncbi:FKBP12-associated protein [Knufia obscura]|uniref:FKBP12-associated protein n=2 Tax=Knufia TaxID=430999 RepID=A0AAN8F5D6_9EURO|nr:FKBP12-associated protein [Knufia obscura]KAK5951701.1 FKBP12-associated protein [Knufia fluminis]